MADSGNRNIAQPRIETPKTGGNPNLSFQTNVKIEGKPIDPANIPKILTEREKARQQRQDARTQEQTRNLSKVVSRVSPKTLKTFGVASGQTTATGLEKAIFIAGEAVLKAQFAIDGVFYGKFQYEGQNKLKRALDSGIINVLDDLSNIDLCNVLNFAINKIPGSQPFDPEQRPTDPLGLAKYNLQKAAYDVQKKIDGFYSSYSESDGSQNKAEKVYNVIQEIKDAFKEINDPEAQSALRDPRLLETFPQLTSVNSFLEKSFVDFNTYSDFRQIPSARVQKLVNDVDKIRAYTILIQGLNTPASAIGFVDSVFPNANIQEQIQRLQKIIDPARLMPLLKNTVDSLKKIQSVCNVFVTFITSAQAIIRISTLIIKALKIVVKFLKKLPIPNQFTVVGITNTLSGFCEMLIKGIDNLLKRLGQLNTLLSLCVGLVNEVSIILFDIIAKVNRMLAGLEACNNVDPQIVKDLQEVTSGLENTAQYFKKFVENYNDKKNTESATFGDFTIQIITEEVVDESFTLRRRYGIALGKNGSIVAKSTPTFASDNQIIINEVKVQLSTLGFVKSDVSFTNIQDLNTISESLSFLFDNDINLEDLDIDNFDNGLDSGENENENEGLGLNAFVNKLQGGKKLRARMRQMMAKNNQALIKDLKNTDPNGKFSRATIERAEKENTKLKIEELESKKKEYIATMVVTPSVVQKAVLLKKIKEIEAEISKLKNS